MCVYINATKTTRYMVLNVQERERERERESFCIVEIHTCPHTTKKSASSTN